MFPTYRYSLVIIQQKPFLPPSVVDESNVVVLLHLEAKEASQMRLPRIQRGWSDAGKGCEGARSQGAHTDDGEEYSSVLHTGHLHKRQPAHMFTVACFFFVFTSVASDDDE